MPELITPPDLTTFAAYCTKCQADRTVHMSTVHMSKEVDAETNEIY